VKKTFLAIALLVSTTTPLSAEEEPLVTDRPDVAESSLAVGKYVFQLETSFAFSTDEVSGVDTDTYSFPTLLRFGILEWLEIRAESEIYGIQTETGAQQQNGFQDIAFGTKAHLLDNKVFVPSLALLFHLNTPAGQDPFSSNAFEPIFKVLMDWELPADFSFGTNIGFDVPVRDDNGHKYARFIYAVALSHPLSFISDDLRFFIEFQGAEPVKDGIPGEHTFDGGPAYFITPNIQIDAFFQVAHTRAATDLGTGLGFSWRYKGFSHGS